MICEARIKLKTNNKNYSRFRIHTSVTLQLKNGWGVFHLAYVANKCRLNDGDFKYWAFPHCFLVDL